MDVFWNTIAAYYAATWPVQLLLVAVAAVLTLLLYLRPTRTGDKTKCIKEEQLQKDR